MTDEELIAEVKRHWEHWAVHLGTQNWRPWFKAIAREEAHGAMQVDWGTGYQKVSVFINRDYYNEDDTDQHDMSSDVLHEQVHLLMARLAEFGRDEMGCDPKSSIIWQLFHNAEENATDAVTSVIWRLHEQTECGKPKLEDLMRMPSERVADLFVHGAIL